jgi:stage V sporulation protein AD
MRRIVSFKREIYVLSCAAVGGKEEGLGPLSEKFDITSRDDRFGMNTWEEAEAEMGRLSLGVALKRAGFYPDKPDVLLAGDLENQCVASATGLYTYGIPYLGLYSACSTCRASI